MNVTAGASMPTRHGDFDMFGCDSGIVGQPHLVLTLGLAGGATPLVRIHSECVTGDVFGSRRCDCGDQLDLSMSMIGERGCGVVIYLRQEGRGIGIENKLRAYALQDQGLDTVDANLALGLPADCRRYNDAVDILQDLGIDACDLLTNNPEKAKAIEASPVRLLKRIPLRVSPQHAHCADYLTVKRERMGHVL